MLVAEECVAPPPLLPPHPAPPRTAQWVSASEKQALESVPLTTVQVCTFCEAKKKKKPFTHYKLKATFIAAN